MGHVLLDMAISLDGFIAGPTTEDAGLHNWYFAPAPPSEAIIAELTSSIGAIIMGRRTYDLGAKNDAFANDPYKAAHFVLTHQPPQQAAKGAEQFVFVTDGIKSALNSAKAAAGEKVVAIGGGAAVAQQYLRAGLVDEIQLHLIPQLLGRGLRLFEQHAADVSQLEISRVVESNGVTHVKYRVLRQ